MKTINDSNIAYKNGTHTYIKNHCKTAAQGNLHCNNYLFDRQGVGCPCLLPEAEGIKDGEAFLVIEPEN